MSFGLMEYVTPQELVRPQAQDGADKYYGPIASGYDEKRDHDPKWFLEQNLIEGMLDDLPKGSWVLDVPCGTGRFFPYYQKKGFLYRGMDKSPDMLEQAARKVTDKNKATLMQGDVRSLALYDKCVDAAIMCRLTRWLSPEDCQRAMKELQRVTRQRIIWTARVANHKHARSIELFESALDGWKIERNEAGSDMDYRIFMAVPC